MAGYWLGPVTPIEVKPHFFVEERIYGHDAFVRRIAELDEINADNDQILILFKGESEKVIKDDGVFHATRGWDADSQLLEDVINELKGRVLPTGWLLHVGVGTLDEWRDPNNPFRKDQRLRVSALPTLMAWNTMKKISGIHALQIENILIMLDD